MENQDSEKKRSETIGVLLALVASETKRPQEACPDDMTLAAFAEGKLKRSEYQKVLHHLHHCPNCYEALEMTCNIPPLQPSWQEVIGAKAKKPLRLVNHYKMSVIAFASLVLVIGLAIRYFTFNGISEPTLSSAVMQTMAQVAPGKSRAEIDEEFNSLIKDTGRGFFQASLPQPKENFQAGVIAGKQALLSPSTETQEEKENVVAYQLGKWVASLWILTRTLQKTEGEFWQSQQAIVEIFINHLSQLENHEGFAEEIQKLQPFFQKLAQTPNDKKTIYILHDVLRKVIENIG